MLRNPKLVDTITAFDRIKKAQSELAKIAPRYDYLEQERPSPVGYRGPRALYGNLFKYARLLTRAIDERAKPNNERIAVFRDSAKESLELELFSTEPVYGRLRNSAPDGFTHRFCGEIRRGKCADRASAGWKIAACQGERTG